MSSLFASLTAAGVFIRIPLGPVPFTLQDFFVLLSGSLLGPRFGPLSQIIYLIIGLIGLPVFSQGGGPGYIFQPTFGYLLAFPVASFIIGKIVHNKKANHPEYSVGTMRLIFAHALGSLVMFAMGVTVLYLNLRYIVMQPIGLTAAVWSGFIIFIPGSILKIILSAVLSKRLAGHLTNI